MDVPGRKLLINVKEENACIESDVLLFRRIIDNGGANADGRSR